MYSLLSGLRARYRKNVERQTALLDPVIRKDLSEMVQDNVPDELLELQHLEVELETARTQVCQLEEKEHFVETRLFKYQKVLKEFQRRSHANISTTAVLNDDPEQPDEPAQATQEQKLQIALKQVADTHKQMLSSIEMFKRRIQQMETRHAELLLQLEECNIFLTAAKKLDETETQTTDADEEAGKLTSGEIVTENVSEKKEAEEEDHQEKEEDTTTPASLKELEAELFEADAAFASAELSVAETTESSVEDNEQSQEEEAVVVPEIPTETVSDKQEKSDTPESTETIPDKKEQAETPL